jgi:hypothetical protein
VGEKAIIKNPGPLGLGPTLEMFDCESRMSNKLALWAPRMPLQVGVLRRRRHRKRGKK